MPATIFPEGVRVVDTLGQSDGPVIVEVTSSPNGSLVAPPGSMAIQRSPGQVWVNVSDTDPGDAWVPFAGGNVTQQVSLTLPSASDLANTTTDIYWAAPSVLPARYYISDITLAGAGYTSAGGSCTLAVGVGAGFSTNLLQAATVDLEAITAGSTSLLLLAVSAATRTIQGGNQIRFRIVSDNADLTGGSLTVGIEYRLLGV